MTLSLRSSALTLLVASLLPTPTLAQNFLAGAPECAQACAALNGIQASCLPPVIPSGFKACFCTAAADARTNPALCVDTCDPTTQGPQVMSWFDNYCPLDTSSVPGATPTPTPTPTASPGTPADSPRTRQRTGAPQPSSPPMPSNVASTPYAEDEKGSWWSNHYQWIVMVIVLVIGFTLIAIGGVYWKRRYDARSNNHAELPTNSKWRPNMTQTRSSSIYGDENTSQQAFMQTPRRVASSNSRAGPSRSTR